MKLYKRICSFTIEGRKLTYPPMTLEFESEFSANGISTAKAKIMNPAHETVNKCQKVGNKFPQIIIDAGYEYDHGTCVIGEIIKWELKKGSPDWSLELTIADKSSLWTSAIVNKSWRSFITARQAATELLSEFGITAVEMVFGEEKSYPNGLAFSGVSLRSALERIARDTRSSFSFVNGQAKFYTQQAGTATAIVLRYDSGLLEATKTEKGYKIKTLFMHKIMGNSIVQLQFDNQMTNLKVIKGKHVFSPESASTEFEAKRL
ncbi:MAG: hypothetical protein AB1444_00320 [Spirochaetota bacterium]